MAGPQDEIKEPAAAQESSKKKSYSKPELVTHGTVQRITEGSRQGHQSDGLGQPNRSP